MRTSLIGLAALVAAVGFGAAAQAQTVECAAVGDKGDFRLVKAGAEHRLSGVFAAPSPGYAVSVSGGGATDETGVSRGEITVTAPGGVAASVVTPVELTAVVRAPKDAKALVFDVKKSFDWGLIRVVCPLN